MDKQIFQECADIVKNLQAIVITAGAGMSVDCCNNYESYK